MARASAKEFGDQFWGSVVRRNPRPRSVSPGLGGSEDKASTTASEELSPLFKEMFSSN